MRRSIITVVLSLAALGITSCAHHPTPKAAVPDQSEFVLVAVIDWKLSDHVQGVLKRAGIQSFSEGSLLYAVMVRRGTEARAAALLRADAASEKYQIRFP
jgi:hypothetical protein